MRGSAAGNWLFSNRRWLRPTKPEEKSIFQSNYDTLCTLHPEFRACSKEDFFAHLTEATSAWAKVLSDCSLLPIRLGDLSCSATEAEIHKEMEDFHNDPLLVKRR